MKKRISDLFRKVHNKLFLLLAKGIIDKKPDGSIHIYSDVLVHGYISGTVNHDTTVSESDISFRKKTHRTIYEQKLDDKVGLYSDSHYSYSSREVVR